MLQLQFCCFYIYIYIVQNQYFISLILLFIPSGLEEV